MLTAEDSRTPLLDEYDLALLSEKCCKHCTKGKRSQLKFFVLQFCLALLLVLGYIGFYLLSKHRQNVLGDPYWKLWEYKSNFFFYGIEGSGERSLYADQLWYDVQLNDGIVVIDITWARQNNIVRSLQHPDHPELSVYQVDAYHGLHCLYRIRDRIISHFPIDEVPRDDMHTLHCIDYIREQLMCHPDVTLQDTYDYVHYSNNKGYQCRDFAAIQTWVEEHKWPNHRAYIDAWLREHMNNTMYARNVESTL
ncbi:hypothetical protein F5884DRAFT_805867 [Xylogone sp. PMI_703]|nr:hypothetical protein F5884DRAFT_805867 [Xylogone sp. PMI_703]